MRVADRWFDVERIDDRVTKLWEPHCVPLIRGNAWHVRGRDRDLLVDSGCGITSLVAAARDLFDRPVVAVATHTHFDHIGSHHEFAERYVHEAEAAFLADPSGENTLYAGFLSDDLVTALPRPGFSMVRDYHIPPAPPTRVLAEGDEVDLGDSVFRVLHLPGHSPGSIGLLEARTGVFFSGDAIYEGDLLDELPRSSIPDYLATMDRLLSLDVTVVHPGHRGSFGRARMTGIAAEYLARRRPAPSA